MRYKIIDFIAFFDRNFNLLFCVENCVKIEIYNGSFFYYNDTVNFKGEEFRCLGKNRYKRLKSK